LSAGGVFNEDSLPPWHPPPPTPREEVRLSFSVASLRDNPLFPTSKAPSFPLLFRLHQEVNIPPVQYSAYYPVLAGTPLLNYPAIHPHFLFQKHVMIHVPFFFETFLQSTTPVIGLPLFLLTTFRAGTRIRLKFLSHMNASPVVDTPRFARAVPSSYV